ncbi:MAG: type II toxin-antitoxin system HicB family antitoxin [Anaerolineae bacterium]
MERYTVLFKKDGKFYVALCLELNVASQGETLAEAKQNIKEAINEYISYMRENDLLDEIQPTPFEVLRAFLSEGIEDAESVSVEVSAIAA